MSNYSYISNAHPSFIDSLYQDYKKNADTIDSDWRKFFEGFDFAVNGANGNGQSNGTAKAATNTQSLSKELQVFSLINAYRAKGHLLSDTNPIKKRKDRKPHLDLSDFGLSEADLKTQFHVGNELNLGKTSLQNIVDRLKQVYTQKLGLEYAYITNVEAKEWLRNRFETLNGSYGFDLERKKHILGKLNETVIFEKFLHTKYIGQKRFSLEGGESTIPAIDAIINSSAASGVKEIVIGMAHRGRLNVLANILGKTYEQIFNEFEGYAPEDHDMGDGDVKYHMGYTSQIATKTNGDVYVNLMPNPSHLEAVDPVVQGYARAKSDVIYESNYDKIVPILIHGDAAIAGQGIVYEIAQMSKLPGYNTGGTIHFVINNQIGFTTDFDDARSAHYCTSIASLVEAPVIHVNGDDVEAVVFAAEIAAEYRQKFNTDIYIDMVCYRKHGHNEGDDPNYTQAGMYEIIRKHKNPREIYIQKLIDDAFLEDTHLAQKMNTEFWKLLQDRLDFVKQKPLPYQYQEPELAWEKLRKATREDFEQSPNTGISKEKVNQIVEALVKLPEGFTPIRKVNRLLKQRRKTMQENRTVDWAAAEMIAYGSILLENHNVRMSGQDVKRGTFSHRHAMMYDEKTFAEYNRLNNISDEQGKFLIYNSFLSEYAVMGFEFGYSLASPHTLTIWEAQFGDFVNGAQIMLDQFITSSETKWQKVSGIVLLLPHGYTGSGPEHSSARLERFLQACAEKNMYVVNITDPANYFHVLRRQQQQPFRKPLVVMSPKSLLRHPKCVSDIFDIIGEDKQFKEILDDNFLTKTQKKKARKVLLCSGKVYYDLQAHREAENIKDVAIIRVEQSYPLAYNQINDILKQFPKKAPLVWVQEEPSNMGAWWHIMFRLKYLNIDHYVARKTSASPATGYKKQHEKEQKDLINRAFA